ncbi:hypothetical protein N0V90_009079 [Kalmusia sp. IMI 367209]|nr:hypothetical protein N0V90_009079 [Kalmusia sp. IMI 367209]
MLKWLSCVLLTAASVLPPAAQADGTYRSRPDLSPPHLNITLPSKGQTAPGYLFVAPYSGSPDLTHHYSVQKAPYIITDTGDLVWSGFGYVFQWAGNFQTTSWKGKDVLFAWEGALNALRGHGHGHHTFLDQHYQNVKEVRGGNHALPDLHEFEVVNGKSALHEIYQPLQLDLSPFGGNDQQTWIVDARFQEVDIDTGNVLFEWRSLDHVSPNDAILSLVSGRAGSGYDSASAWDYLHINSVTKGKDGHFLVSARHTSTIYKINGIDGSIIWRLGGKSSNFELGPNVDFGFQHHARYLTEDPGSEEVISLFDNSAHSSDLLLSSLNNEALSRGIYVKLDHVNSKATLQREFLPPNEPLLARSQGSIQTLTDGNVLVNWGSEGQITEYTADGTAIFHAQFVSNKVDDILQNYRAFRFSWSGYSPEPIAVFAEKVADDEIDVYVSWNGDTQAASWRFAWVEDNDGNRVKKSKDIVKTGFETVYRLPTSATTRGIHVEALGEQGQVLSVSERISAVPAYWLKKEQSASRTGEKDWYDSVDEL